VGHPAGAPRVELLVFERLCLRSFPAAICGKPVTIEEFAIRATCLQSQELSEQVEAASPVSMEKTESLSNVHSGS